MTSAYLASSDSGPAIVPCPHCKEAIRPDAKFCRHCGAAVARLPETPTERVSEPAVAPEAIEEKPASPRLGAIDRRIVLGAVGVAVLLAIGGLIYLEQSSPSAPPASSEMVSTASSPASASSPPAPAIGNIQWSDMDNTAAPCSTVRCLADAMDKADAPTDAVAFAERLSAARKGRPAWATSVVPYGPVSLIYYQCGQCRSGGFAFLDRNGSLIPDTTVFAMLDSWLTGNAALNAAHPNALLVSGVRFASVTSLQAGGQEFKFLINIADCQACEPYSAVAFSFNFDQDGRFQSKCVIGETEAATGPIIR